MSKLSYSATTTSRHSPGHSTISAFSSSANPDEDWTKISNLAERRKIQNRIAQRNYRRKSKKRLQDLERKLELSSASPPQMPTGVKNQDQEGSSQFKKSPDVIHHQPPPRILQSQHKPPLEGLMFTPLLEGEGSRTPALVGYHTCPPYPQQQPYHLAFPPGYQYGDCLPLMMHFHKTSEQEEEDAISQLHMSYPSFSAIDSQVSHGYETSTHHVNTVPNQ